MWNAVREGFLPKAAAVPATVSGERDAHALPARTGPDRAATGSHRIREGVHRALTREPGDLPALSLMLSDPGVGRGTERVRSSDEPCGWGRTRCRGSRAPRPSG